MPISRVLLHDREFQKFKPDLFDEVSVNIFGHVKITDGQNIATLSSLGGGKFGFDTSMRLLTAQDIVTAQIRALTNTDVVTTEAQYKGRADSFTATGNGTTVDAHTSPMKHFSIAAKAVGGIAISWNIVLEGSLDGTTFGTILTVSSLTAAVIFSAGAIYPSLYYRARCTAVVLGTANSINTSIVGIQ